MIPDTDNRTAARIAEIEKRLTLIDPAGRESLNTRWLLARVATGPTVSVSDVLAAIARAKERVVLTNPVLKAFDAAESEINQLAGKAET